MKRLPLYGGRLVENLVQLASAAPPGFEYDEHAELVPQPSRVTPAEYAATMAALDRVLEELEPTQEIARVAFELPDLEQTQEIPDGVSFDGSWRMATVPTPTGEVRTFERVRK